MTSRDYIAASGVDDDLLCLRSGRPDKSGHHVCRLADVAGRLRTEASQRHRSDAEQLQVASQN